MKAKEKLQELKPYIYRCIHCRACRFSYSGEPNRKGVGEYFGTVQGCPSGRIGEWEAYWNSGKVWIARAILDGTLPVSTDLQDILYKCTTCGNCQVQCENCIPTVDLVELLREAYVDEGLPLLSRHQVIRDSVLKNNNPYLEKAEERAKWYKGKNLNRKAEIGYFVGCTCSYRQKNIAEATANFLDKTNTDYTILTDEACCGSPFFRIGCVDAAVELMKRNIESFKKAGVKTLVFSCAGCYRTFKVDYPKYAGKLPFELKLITEYVLDHTSKGAIKPKKEFKKKITWHDPCHTGRHIILNAKGKSTIETPELKKFREEWYEIPRKLLKSIPGVEFVEMYRVKDDSWCCGAGGGFRSGFSDYSLETSYERLKEAEAVGAEAIATFCPFCYRNLKDAAEKYNSKIEVYDLLELLDMVT